jgi:hypothetical protein
MDFVRPLYPYYWDQKYVIKKQFAGKNISATIFSDGLSGELSEFFLKFKTRDLKFLPIDSAKITDTGSMYYLLNGDLYPTVKNKLDSLMKKNENKSVIITYQKNNVYLYKVNNAVLQILKEK